MMFLRVSVVTMISLLSLADLSAAKGKAATVESPKTVVAAGRVSAASQGTEGSAEKTVATAVSQPVGTAQNTASSADAAVCDCSVKVWDSVEAYLELLKIPFESDKEKDLHKVVKSIVECYVVMNENQCKDIGGLGVWLDRQHVERTRELRAHKKDMESGDEAKKSEAFKYLKRDTIILKAISEAAIIGCDCFKELSTRATDSLNYIPSIISCIKKLDGEWCSNAADPAEAAENREVAISLREALQSELNSLNKMITLYQKQLLIGQTATQTEVAADNMKRAVKDRDQIERFVGKKRANTEYIVGFEDYRSYFYSFNAGVEYVTINDAFQKGFARAGYKVFQRFGKDLSYTSDEKGPGYYGVHVGGDVKLTSSAEQLLTTQETTTESTTTQGQNKSLEADLSLFIPLFRDRMTLDNNRKVFTYLGLIGYGGLRKTDGSDFIDRRFYAGIRSAISPDLYFDVLYGDTASLKSRRMEIRGQVPLPPFPDGTRLYVGTIANFGVDSKKRNVDPALNENDVIRFYLIWNVDFDAALASVKTK